MYYRMKKVWVCLLLSAVILISLTACSGGKPEQTPDTTPPQESEAADAEQSENLPSETPEKPENVPSEQPEKTEDDPKEQPQDDDPPENAEQPPQEETPPAEKPPVPPEEQTPEVLSVHSQDDIQNELYAAISAVRQPLPMDISGVTLSENPDIDVKNLYFGLIGRDPELKYASSVSASVKNGVLTCLVTYMPYMTGDWPESCEDAQEIASLGELLRAAEAHIGSEFLPIKITDKSMTPDNMNRILNQAGGGFILCELSRDATAITYSPAMGMTMEGCLSLLGQADLLAEQIAARELTGSMTEREKAEALYAYLTGNVKYDQRYYSDRENMPFESQTAIGALRDNLAICGGYSHALKLLFEKAGIPCYNVTGKYYSENHMWNIARVDGEWLWFDATSDRGGSPEFGFRRFAVKELDAAQYKWDPDIAELIKQAVG